MHKLGKGFRKIVVNDHAYKWRFNGIISVRDIDNTIYLSIDFGWFDVFLYINDPESRPKEYFPKRITPSFVKDAIVFALNNGWGHEHNKKLALEYDSGVFSVSRLSDQKNSQ